jgi:hypothetical protein
MLRDRTSPSLIYVVWWNGTGESSNATAGNGIIRNRSGKLYLLETLITHREYAITTPEDNISIMDYERNTWNGTELLSLLDQKVEYNW